MHCWHIYLQGAHAGKQLITYSDGSNACPQTCDSESPACPLTVCNFAGTGNPELRDTVSAAMGHKALADSKRAGRKIMLGMCGGHSAYHDARSAYELGVGFQVQSQQAAA